MPVILLKRPFPPDPQIKADRTEVKIRRLHRTCRAKGYAEADYADFGQGSNAAGELKTPCSARALRCPGFAGLGARKSDCLQLNAEA
jgi:hypothetical protein